MSEPNKRDFDREAGTWDENLGRVKLAHCVMESILGSIPVSADMDVIDYGCGTGLLLLGIQPHVNSIVGLDSSAGMLSVLDRKLADEGVVNVRTMRVDLEKETLPDLHVDMIVSGMTMHHVQDVDRVIGRLADMLHDGGYLAIADLDSEDGSFHGDNTGIAHFGFDRDALTLVLESAGFENIRNITACTVPKEVPGKGLREFSVFLMTAQKSRRQIA